MTSPSFAPLASASRSTPPKQRQQQAEGEDHSRARNSHSSGRRGRRRRLRSRRCRRRRRRRHGSSNRGSRRGQHLCIGNRRLTPGTPSADRPTRPARPSDAGGPSKFGFGTADASKEADAAGGGTSSSRRRQRDAPKARLAKRAARARRHGCVCHRAPGSYVVGYTTATPARLGDAGHPYLPATCRRRTERLMAQTARQAEVRTARDRESRARDRRGELAAAATLTAARRRPR